LLRHVPLLPLLLCRLLYDVTKMKMKRAATRQDSAAGCSRRIAQTYPEQDESQRTSRRDFDSVALCFAVDSFSDQAELMNNWS
jgi:hypothetical protein